MGVVKSILKRPLRTMNIDNRTERILSRKKPIPSPTFPSVIKQKEAVDKLNPNFMEEHYKKNTNLDKHLKNVFVTSTDPAQPTQETKHEQKILRHTHMLTTESEFDCKEKTVIRVGKCSLNEALMFLNEYANDSSEHTIQKIAETYKLDKDVVADIVRNFSIPVSRLKDNTPNDSYMKIAS